MSINNNTNRISIEFFKKSSSSDNLKARNAFPTTKELGCKDPIRTRWEVCTRPRTSICAIHTAADDERM